MTAAANSVGTRSTRREVLAGHPQPEDFRHRAACRSVDPEVFFPTAVAGPELVRQVGVAKAVCAGCPVREACLSWALAHQPDGIAGGMTEHERRTERARRAQARRAAAAGLSAGVRARGPGGCEGEGTSAGTVVPSRFSHDLGLAGHTSSGRTPIVAGSSGCGLLDESGVDR